MYSQTWSSNCLQYYFPGEKRGETKRKRKREMEGGEKKKGRKEGGIRTHQDLCCRLCTPSRRLLSLVLLWPWKSRPHLRTFAPTPLPSRAWLSCQFPANDHEVGVRGARLLISAPQKALTGHWPRVPKRRYPFPATFLASLQPLATENREPSVTTLTQHMATHKPETPLHATASGQHQDCSAWRLNPLRAAPQWCS